jgi:hypothetical protein
MTLNEALDRLFSEKFLLKEIHCTGNPNFIKDGVFNEDKWKTAKRKVLFFYKEAYGKDYNDLRVLIREWGYPKYTMWRRSSEIAYLLQNIECDFQPNLSQARNCATDALFSSAAINLKKSGGKSSSNYDDLLEYAKSDGELLKMQIEIIRPDIVVMGNIKSLVDNHVVQLGRPLDEDGILYEYKGTIFIDYWHPAYQIPAVMYYYTLALIYSKYISKLCNQPL